MNSFIKNPPFPQNYGNEFLVLDHGKGSFLYDEAGREYLDFGSGIAVNALGHGNDKLAETASSQMKKIIHSSNLYTTRPTITLAETLCRELDYAAVHFGNSGTEANEAALKYARAWSLRTKGEGHHKILSFTGSFHGRSMGALSVTSTEKYRVPFGPLIPGCSFAAYNDPAGLQILDSGEYCAVIVEILQGEGGLTMMSPEFAEALRKKTEENNVLIIIDEIQTGLFRTGTALASYHLGLKADIITLSKPLAGGLPLSATLISDKVNQQIHLGDHGSTFGGGPVTTAVALEVWSQLKDPSFQKELKQKIIHFDLMLQTLAHRFTMIKGVKGLGMLKGLELSASAEVLPDVMKSYMDMARENGLLILRAGSNVLRFAPPLSISEEELTLGCGVLHKIFSSGE